MKNAEKCLPKGSQLIATAGLSAVRANFLDIVKLCRVVPGDLAINPVLIGRKMKPRRDVKLRALWALTERIALTQKHRPGSRLDVEFDDESNGAIKNWGSHLT